MSSLPMIMQLSERLLVETMRDYAATLDGARTGLLKGLNDAQIGHALTLIHGRIEAPWTIGQSDPPPARWQRSRQIIKLIQ